MKTAKEILNGYVKRSYGYQQKDIISAINEARRECLIEAASKFDDYELPTSQTKEEILSLINELQ